MKRIRLKRLSIKIAAFLLLALLIAGAAIVWDGLHDELAVADVAVVLGNKIDSDGRPSARLQARLDKTVELYQQNFFTHILVSGGIGREGFDEAEVMKQYLIEKGIPEESILVDSAGLTTYDTARNASQLMREKGWQSAMVISQYFHITRTRLAFRRCGVASVYSAHAQFFEIRDFYSVFREIFGVCSYLMRRYD
jgi:vancomycin permeability regulator SanA